MKRIVQFLILIMSLILLPLSSQEIGNINFERVSYKITKPIIKKKKIIKDKVVISNERFLSILGQLESNNDYTQINAYGYIGKYQMGRAALADLGINISVEDFKNNPDSIFPPHEQDLTCIRLLKMNKLILNNYISLHVDSIYKEVRITKAGMLASAHLVGPGSVMLFLNSKGDIDPVDGNGTPLSLYMRKFQDVEIKL